MRATDAHILYNAAFRLLKAETPSKEMDSNTFNKLILIVALLYDESKHSEVKDELYVLIQNYMLTIYSGVEWYKYFENNSSGVCFMTEPAYWERHGKECLIDYIDCRFKQYRQLTSDIDFSQQSEDPLLILYWIYNEEKFSYYPDYSIHNLPYKQIVEINYLKERLVSNQDFNDFKSAYQLVYHITKTVMENSFSFKYIKLGVSLVFLLISSIIPGMGQYIFLALGGAFLMTTFASLGNSNYRGYPTKSGYNITRYIGATLFLIVAAIQIYVYFAMPNSVHFSIYATVVDIALVAYLLMFKPSSTSTSKKIFKTVGYGLILIAVNALQGVKALVNHYTYTTYEIGWGTLFLIILLLIAGIVCIILGNRNHD